MTLAVIMFYLSIPVCSNGGKKAPNSPQTTMDHRIHSRWETCSEIKEVISSNVILKK